MSSRPTRALRGRSSLVSGNREGRQWGRDARRLRPSLIGLEDRTLLTSLTDVLNAYDLGVKTIAGDSNLSSTVDSAITGSPQLLGQDLGSLLGIGDIFKDPFQANLGQQGQGFPTGSTWSQVLSDISNYNEGGPGSFQILYPTSAPSDPGNMQPDSNGNLLAIAWQYAPKVPLSIQLSGVSTGFSYIDNGMPGGSGTLTGTLSATGQNAPIVNAQVVMGVDLQNGSPSLFVYTSGAANTYGTNGSSADTSISVPNFTGTESLSTPTGLGLQIGDLQNVTMSVANASINLQAGLSLQASTGADGKLRSGDFNSSSSPPSVFQGTMTGNVTLGASFSASLPPLPLLDWTGNFSGTVNTATSTPWLPSYQLMNVTADYVQNLLANITTDVTNVTSKLSILGDLGNFLEKPLPIIGQSIAGLTGLNSKIPVFPALNGPLSTLTDVINTLYGMGFEINGDPNLNTKSSSQQTTELAQMVGNLIQGQYVNILQWSDSKSNVPILSWNPPPIPLFSFLGIANIDAFFGANATISYNVGLGFDTRGLWVKSGTSSNPTFGMTFSAYAGLEGQINLIIATATAGGDIGFEITPYVNIASDPFTVAAHSLDPAVPLDHVYLSDLRAFGSNDVQDFLGDLSEGISGAFTGDIFGQVQIGFHVFGHFVGFTLRKDFTITIPVFNYQRTPAWPASLGSPGSGVSIVSPGQFPGGVLSMSGSSGPDTIQLLGANGTVYVESGGGLLGPYQNVTEVVFDGNAGADHLTAAPGFNIPIYANAAGDTSPVYFQGGSGNNTLIGGTANDTLIGGAGNDSIVAGSGNDLIFSGDGNDTIIGGTGTDTIYAGGGNDLVTGGSGAYEIVDGAGTDTVYGGQGGVGTGTEEVYQQQSDGTWTFVNTPMTTYPTIYAGGGNDLVYGPTSGATIYGEAGNNTIHGGAGGNTIYGGTGNDTIYGSSGNDLIYAGDGNDLIYGMSGNNTIYGGPGQDTIFGGDGQDLNGPGSGDGLSAGSNLLIAGSGTDTIYGDSTAHNTLVGGSGSDTLYAGSGGDTLESGTGSCALYGGPGNDTLALNFIPTGTTQQPDTLSGGPGYNTILIDGANTQITTGSQKGTYASDTIKLFPDTTQGAPPNSYTATQQSDDNSGNPTSGSITFTMPADIAGLAVSGGNGNDHISVDPSIYQNVTLEGGAGNNTLIAGSGNDVLIGGGNGNNLLEGGAGDDILYGAQPPALAAQALNLPGGTVASGTTSGTPGNDTLIGGAGDNQLYAGNGNDVLIGGDAVQQPSGLWVLEKTVGRNMFFAGSGNDLMIAGPGTLGSQMEGGTGNDTMVGGNGLNIMDGGGGNALMLGGNLGNTMYADFSMDSQDPNATTPSVSITAATWTSGVATITTSSAPSVGFQTGQNVVISGTAGYDGTFTIKSVISSTEFTLALGNNPGNASALGSLITVGNVTMVGGSGIDYLSADGPGNDLLIGDGNTNRTGPLVAQYWAEAEATALNRGVVLQPPASLAGTAQQEIQEYNALQTQDDQLAAQIEALQTIQNPPQWLSNEIVSLRNQQNFVLAELIEVNNLLGATANPDILVAGDGTDTLMGGASAAVLEGGIPPKGSVDVLYYRPNDTYLGDIGGQNELLFLDTIPGDTIQLTYDKTGNDIQVAMGSTSNPAYQGVSPPYDWVFQPGIQILGVAAQGSSESVDVNFGQSVPFGLSVQLGPGNDTIDASTFEQPETLLSGSGSDVIKVDSQLSNGDVFQGGTGTSELDIVAPGSSSDTGQTNVITVKGGEVSIGNVLLQNQNGSITAGNSTSPEISNFQTIKVVGGSGTNNLFTDGSFPNVILEGGSGTNYLTATLPANGNVTMIGGPGSNDFVASGGTIRLQGGSGPNTYNLNGPGNYTVDGTPVPRPTAPTTPGVSAPAPFGINESTTTDPSPPVQSATVATVGPYAIYAGGVYGFSGDAGFPPSSNASYVYDTTTGMWTTHELSRARFGMTVATIGMYAILAGGFDSSGAPSSAVDIFDASSGQWSATSLSQARANMSVATVGTYVVLAGGVRGIINGAPSSAVDIFDLSTGQWTSTTLPSGVARSNMAVATVGRYVVFAGGQTNNGPTGAVDLFDASTGAFLAPPTQLSQARDNISVGTIDDYAIFAGGDTSNGPSTAVDVFNASNGKFTTDSLSQARDNMAVATLGNYAIFAGGSTGYGPSASVDVFDAASGIFTTDSLSQARDNMSAATAGNYAVFAGGDGVGGQPSSAVDVFDSSTGAFVANPPQLSQARDNISAATLGSYAIFAGGMYLDKNLNMTYSDTIDIFDASTGAFVPSPPQLSLARDGITFGHVGNYLLLAGGNTGETPAGPVSSYNVDSLSVSGNGHWSDAVGTGPVPIAYGESVTTVGDFAILTGGAGGTPGATAYLYDGATEQWSTVDLSQARYGMTVATIGEYAIFAGGIDVNGNASSAVDIFDASTDQWSTASLSQPRESMTLAMLGNFAIFAGGQDANGNLSSAVDIFDSSTGTFVVDPPQLSTAEDNIAVNGGGVAPTVGNYAIFADEATYGGVVDVYAYNPSTETWTDIPESLPSGAYRDNMSVATVGNYAIFAGGESPSVASPEPVAAVDIFDATTGKFVANPPELSQARFDISVAVVGNYAIFAGGEEFNRHSSSPTTVAAIDVFDAATGSFIANPPHLSEGRFNMSVLTVGNYAVFAGGYGFDSTGNVTILSAVDIFNADASAGSQWSSTTLPSGVARVSMTAAKVGNYAIFAGGESDNGPTSAVDIFDANSGNFATSPPQLPQPSLGLKASGALADRAVIFFGSGEGPGAPSNEGYVFSLPPTVSSVIASNTASGGTAAITYSLIGDNGASNPASIQVQYSVNGGPWRDATAGSGGNGITGLTCTPAGTQYTFVWNTAADLGDTDNPSVSVRITASDSTGVGATVVSPSFAVNNTGIVNNLVIDESSDTNGDSIAFAQAGATVTADGKLNGSASTNLTVSAADMTGITVIGGTAANRLDASNTRMPISLYGGTGSGADTLIGGSGSDTFVYSGTGSTYTGGINADNTLVYPANSGDLIQESLPELSVNGTDEHLGTISSIENFEASGEPIAGATVTSSANGIYEVTVTTLYPPVGGFSANESVTISGMEPAAYDGLYVVTPVVDHANEFTYALTNDPGTATAFGMADPGNPISVNNTYQTLWPVYGLAPANPAINSMSAVTNSPITELSASFTENNPGASASDFSALIHWGDGTTSVGTVTAASVGQETFEISGSHIYATIGNWIPYVTILDSAGSATTTSVQFSGGLELTNGTLKNVINGSSTTVDTSVASFLVENNDLTVFTLHNDNRLFVIAPGSSPQSIDIGIQSVWLGPDGTLYALHTAPSGQVSGGTDLDEFAPGSTSNPTVVGSVLNVVQDSNRNFYRLDVGGNLYVLLSGQRASLGWTTQPNPDETGGGAVVRSITLDSDGSSIDVMYTNGDYYRFDGANWSFIAGPHLAVTAPGSATAGQPFSFTVQVLDALNEAVLGYTGTVYFRAAAESLGNYSFMAADAGFHTFSLTLDAAIKQDIEVLDSGTGIFANASVMVNPASAPAVLRVVMIPQTLGQSTLQEGTQVNTATQYMIFALDQYGNIVTSDNDPVTLASSDPNATFSPASAQLNHGETTVSVTFAHNGSQTLTATDQDPLTGTSDPVSVSPGPATHFAILAPVSVPSGQPFSIRITAEDANGNVATGYAGTVEFTDYTAFSGVPSSYTFTAQDAGVLSLPAVVANVAGAQVFGVMDASNAKLTDPTPPTITVSLVEPTTFSVVSGSGGYGGSATLVATLTASGLPLAGKTVSFTLTVNGNTENLGPAVTNASGVATVTGVSLTGLSMGTISGAIGTRFAGDSADAPATGTGDLTVNAAPATLSFGTLTFTYDGSSKTTTVTTNPAGLSGVTITYSQNGTTVPSPAAAGVYQVTASLNNPNYAAPSISGSLTINQVTPVITWASPTAITFGTALSATQLDATANILGMFTYTPGAGTILNAGSDLTLSVIFTPNDAVDYHTVNASTSIDVAKANLVISWLQPTNIVFGTPLGASQLDATASLPGTFVYTLAPGTVLNAGRNQTLSAVFTLADSRDYNPVNVSTTINVLPASLTITALNAAKVAGQTNPAFSVRYSGFVNGQGPSDLSGALIFSTPATASSPPGSYPIIPGGLSSSNYAITYADGTLLVTPTPTPTPTTTPTPAPVEVTGLHWQIVKVKRKKPIKELVISFSGALDPGAADNPAGYMLDAAKRVKKRGLVYRKPVRIGSISYSSANDTVTLILRGRPPKQPMQLTINAGAVLDAEGRPIDGNNDGQPGGNVVARLNGRGLISMARAMAEPERLPARVVAAAVDALMADGPKRGRSSP